MDRAESPLDQVVVVLYRPEDPVNIGASVRALKNMGLAWLRLVQPVPYSPAELQRLAHNAEDTIGRIAVYAELDEALADVHFVVGTAASTHAGYRLSYDLREMAAELVQRAGHGRVALLFGPEADGLDRAALDRCHRVLSIPADPAYPALNLAQSVLLFVYELRQACALPVSPTPAGQPATQAQLERLFDLTEESLAAIGFFKYNPAAVMHTLRQVAYRAELHSQEVALLTAIARQIIRAAPPKESTETAQRCQAVPN